MIQFIQFNSAALNTELSIFAIDDQVILTTAQMRDGCESVVFTLAKERAIAMEEPLLVYDLEDHDLMNFETGEVSFFQDVEFDEQKILSLAKDKGYEVHHFAPQHPDPIDYIPIEPELLSAELTHNPYYAASIVWTQEDLVGYLLDEGFHSYEDSCDLVAETLKAFIQPILFTDLLKSAIWHAAPRLPRLPRQSDLVDPVWGELAA